MGIDLANEARSNDRSATTVRIGPARISPDAGEGAKESWKPVNDRRTFKWKLNQGLLIRP